MLIPPTQHQHFETLLMSSQCDNPPDDAPERPTRKPAGVSWESFAEHRIREAQAAGAFENLPGHGRPIAGIDEPWDENSWVKRKLREEGVNVLPPMLEARKEVEQLRSDLPTLHDEAEVRRRIEAANVLIRKALATPAPASLGVVLLLDVESELRAWRNSRMTSGKDDRQ